MGAPLDRLRDRRRSPGGRRHPPRWSGEHERRRRPRFPPFPGIPRSGRERTGGRSLIRRRAALLTPVLLAILLHLPAVAHEFVFDDRGAILENPLLGRVADMPKILTAPWWNTARAGPGLYRPITTMSFAIDRALAGGLRPGWFHLVNVLLHGGVTWLVARLALLLLDSPTGACIAGLLFAVHPVHVEAVAGVVGRAEILAAGLTIATVLMHRAALMGAGRMADLASAGAPVAILLAMLSKESAFTAPVLVAICDDWAGGR